MYAHHFALRAEPFSLTPDPSFLYLSPGHREALAALEVGLRGRRGLMVMTGEVGTGKTTLLYSLLTRLGSDVRTAYVANTKLPFDLMLHQALTDFGVSCASRDRLEQLAALNAFLHTCATEGGTAALVVDEAQNLDTDAFENLRLLSNFETFTSKLLQIVLVGQPELETKLKSPSLRQVAERIGMHCHVNPLSSSESRKYVEHRLRCVGGSLDLFTPGALRLLIKRSRGIPRRINIICHNALLFAYGEDAPRVTRPHVRAAVREREGRGLVTFQRNLALMSKTSLAPWLAAASALVATLAATAFTLEHVRRSPSAVVGSTGSSREPAPALSALHPARNPRDADTPLRVGDASDNPASLALAADESGTRADGELLHAAGAVPVTAAPRDRQHDQPDALSAGLHSGIRDRAKEGKAGGGRVAEQITGGDASGFRFVRVTPGATLASLTKEVYGVVTPQALIRVQLANPQITDRDHIVAGDTLRFPELGRQAADAVGAERGNL